jgi:hypothetical protein
MHWYLLRGEWAKLANLTDHVLKYWPFNGTANLLASRCAHRLGDREKAERLWRAACHWDRFSPTLVSCNHIECDVKVVSLYPPVLQPVNAVSAMKPPALAATVPSLPNAAHDERFYITNVAKLVKERRVTEALGLANQWVVQFPRSTMGLSVQRDLAKITGGSGAGAVSSKP